MTTNETRRRVMQTAWSLFRADPARGFADALSGAWRWVKRAAERAAEATAWMRRAGGRQVRLGQMVQSPIRRNLTGRAYAGVNASSAGYVTSRMGA